MEELLTVTETAKELRVSRRRVQQLLEEGRLIKAQNVRGKAHLIPLGEVRRHQSYREF